MTISLAQSLSDLRGFLHEPRAVRWADADLTTLLDLGQKHVAALTQSYQKRVTFTDADATEALIANLREYTLDTAVGSGGFGLSDVLSIQQIYLDNTELTEIIPKAVPFWNERTKTTGTIAAWFEFAGVLTFIPTPTAASLASYDLEIVYAAYPADWTTGDSVLPEGMSDLVMYFAAALALFAVQKYGDAMALYEQYLALSDAYVPITVTQRPTTKAELRLPPQLPRQRAAAARVP